jgi:hypothetical protein
MPGNYENNVIKWTAVIRNEYNVNEIILYCFEGINKVTYPYDGNVYFYMQCSSEWSALVKQKCL